MEFVYEKILKMNRKFAKFMGFREEIISKVDEFTGVKKTYFQFHSENGKVIRLRELKYHTHLYLLIKVAEKFRNTNFGEDKPIIEFDKLSCYIKVGKFENTIVADSMIEAIYLSLAKLMAYYRNFE
jgi:hypothetical protein